jgi:hypothetical protein
VSVSDGWLAFVLTIGKLGSSASQLDYYERQAAAGGEDYYAGRGEPPGSGSAAGTRRWTCPSASGYLAKHFSA